jgi:hypothetical protein
MASGQKGPLIKRNRSLMFDEDQDDDSEVTERLSKRQRWLIRAGSSYRSKDDIFAGKMLAQGVESGRNIAEVVKTNGLDYYYEAGKNASAITTWSHSKIDEFLRIEHNLFEFQRLCGKPQEWPADGLPIDDCTAFMQMLADSGKGLLDKTITKRYFLKLVRIFGDLVRPFVFQCGVFFLMYL